MKTDAHGHPILEATLQKGVHVVSRCDLCRRRHEHSFAGLHPAQCPDEGRRPSRGLYRIELRKEEVAQP